MPKKNNPPSKPSLDSPSFPPFRPKKKSSEQVFSNQGKWMEIKSTATGIALVAHSDRFTIPSILKQLHYITVLIARTPA